MWHWDRLIDEQALTTLIPDAYAAYRRPIQEAIGVFLSGLPASDQAAVLADQAALGAAATPEARLARLAQSCPALHKLGQVLARDRRLSPELRTHLQKLESLPPSLPLATIAATLRDELGPLERLGVALDPPALAEASVAVVVPFRDHHGQPGVFKLLKPGVDARLERELCQLEVVGAYLDERCDAFQIPQLDYQEAFEQVRARLVQELRLDLEQTHLVQARHLYANDPEILIPALRDGCTPRVTAMERVFGHKVTEHHLEGPAADRLARRVARALIARPVFAVEPRALFHGDPHAGNLFHTDDGRLAILDWSLAGTLDETHRVAIVQVMLAAVTLDGPRIAAVLASLADPQRIDRPALDQVVRNALRPLRHGTFPGFSWLMQLLDAAVQTARLRVGSELLLYRKTLHTLEGVVADIRATGQGFEGVLETEFLRHLIAEWPSRWMLPTTSRALATRLSNLDLAQLALSGPATMARFWVEEARDWIATAPVPHGSCNG